MTAPSDHRPASAPGRVTSTVTSSQICDLIAWARRLSDAGVHRADPAELAAFHHAKQDLLRRIQHGGHTRTALSGQPSDQQENPQ